MADPAGWLDWLTAPFRDDPWRLLTILGGSGGLVYWYDRIRNRSRIRVRVLDERPDPATLDFEVENVGLLPTSLLPQVTVTGYLDGGTRRLTLDIRDDADRRLPPHEPRRFEAFGSEDEPGEFLYTWYRTYTFRTTRGRPRRLRRRHLRGPYLSPWRFWLESLLVRTPLEEWMMRGGKRPT